ncbi:MAG: YbjN domain-containing protein [Oscillospiraceae bacterium]|nr:YbjN domain-containing protein [Oscillospiraceae bacterium]
MSENMEMAKSMYERVATTLDNMELNYQRHDEDMVITLGMRGEDMDHDMLLIIREKNAAFSFLERLPFHLDPQKADEIAKAVCNVNNHLVLGGFTYEAGSDTMNFELSIPYNGSLIGEETIRRILVNAVKTVEAYDDKFLALNKGYISSEEFKK